jgi:hypothetical protein
MWWLSFAWLLIGATITNVIVWTPLLLDAALSGTFDGQLSTHARAPADLHAQVSSALLPTSFCLPAVYMFSLVTIFTAVIQAVQIAEIIQICSLCSIPICGLHRTR